MKHCKTDTITKIVGPHTGAYCSICGIWIKWLSKKEISSLSDCEIKEETQLELKDSTYPTNTEECPFD